MKPGNSPSAASPVAIRDLRQWLERLGATGRLAVIRDNVPLKHTLAAIAKRLDGKQAAFFPKPDGHAMPVISGFMSRRAWIAEAMGVQQSELLSTFRHAAENPVPWKEVGAGVCQQVVHRDIDLHALLPIPTHSEHDNGPYITAGMVIARNPVTGIQNVSINRIQVHRKDQHGDPDAAAPSVCVLSGSGSAKPAARCGGGDRRRSADLARIAGDHADRP